MITDLPNSEDFKSIAKEWLVQSFQIIYDYSEELEHLTDWKDEDWHYHRGKLSTALVLIHQAVEAQMKAEICNVSPFFLLELKPQDWPTLPNSKRKSFNELFIIGAESLIRVYLGVCDHTKDKEELTKLFEEVRIKRNQIVHGLYKEVLEPKYLLELQFRAAKEIFEHNFWKLLKAEEMKHPLYNELDDDELLSQLYYKVDFIEKYLGTNKFKKFLKVSGRKYYCPGCTRIAQDWDYGSVYLQPNKPDSTNATCIICDFKYSVKREDCPNNECIGNVIGLVKEEELVCLSCLEPLNEKD